jgi:4-hydroxy-3-methylbut-2-enyl diphosphate reductase
MLALLCASLASAFHTPASPAGPGVWGVKRRAPSAASLHAAADGAEPALSPKQERRRIIQSPNFHRQGFKAESAGVESQMVSEFTSQLINEMKDTSYTYQKGDLTIKLAKSYGFCWGVDRAVAMAYEARAHFPEQRIHITNEIIHNPGVNERLAEMDIDFLPVQGGEKQFDHIQQNDVVILPAFGATIQEMQLLDKKGVQIVDTTCPWVAKVWTAVEKHRKLESTSVIHGKWAHEETIATASFADVFIIVKDIHEAEYVCNYIVNGGDKAEFMEKFKNAMSAGFDPDKDLVKVGLANQTTMYKRETRAIGRLFEKTMMHKYGPAEVKDHYAEFDTICDATQERQDAITELMEEPKLDFILIVGGFDSSNTCHLKEIPHMQHIPSFHIDRAERITADGSIEHREIDGYVPRGGFSPSPSQPSLFLLPLSLVSA